MINKLKLFMYLNSASRYLDNRLNIDNPYFEITVKRIYPPELQINKANVSDTEIPDLDLRLSISNGFVLYKIYDKCDNLYFEKQRFSIFFFFFGW